MTTPHGSCAGGFLNDMAVSSHGDSSVHAHKRDRLKATSVSHGTTLERGSIFTRSPALWNPPKRYSVENVQKNYSSILSEDTKSGNCSPPAGGAAFKPRSNDRGLSPRLGKDVGTH